MSSLPRLAAIPVAIVVLVGVPALVSKGLGGSNPSAASTTTPVTTTVPAPLPATLTVTAVGDAGGSGHPIFLSVLAAGSQPAKPATISDIGGVHTATVARVDRNACSRSPVRSTGLGMVPWCLEITHVDAGHTLTGAVAGANTRLTLSVTRRNSFFWLPAIAIALGFFAAWVVRWFAKWFQRRIVMTEIEALLVENDAAGINRIVDLQVWANGHLTKGSESDLIPVLSSAIKDAPTVQKARAALGVVLRNKAPLGEKYVEGAEAEARKATVTTGDLFETSKTSVKRLSQSPAEDWLKGTTALLGYSDVLDKLVATMEDGLKETCKKELEAKVDDARGAIRAVDTPAQVDSASAAVHAAKQAYEVARANPECVEPPKKAPVPKTVDKLGASYDSGQRFHLLQTGVALRGLAIDAHLESGAFQLSPPPAGPIEDMSTRLALLDASVPPPPHPPSLKTESPIRVVWDRLGEQLITLAIVIVILGFAGVTVWQSTFVTKPAFAGFSDYFALFAASFGSTVVLGGIAAVIGWWSPKPSKPAAA